MVVTLTHEVLTHAEKSLTRADQAEAVNHIRQLFQETVATEFREAVQRLTGRRALAFISRNISTPTSSSSTGPRGRPDVVG